MDNFYLAMAHRLGAKSHCLKRKVGAVLVTADLNHVMTAINNPIPDSNICEENGCLREQIHSGTQLEVCRCVHCETQLIAQCAKEGICSLDSTIYTTLYPCAICARAIISAGVKRIVYSFPYTDKRSIELFAQAQIQVIQL